MIIFWGGDQSVGAFGLSINFGTTGSQVVVPFKSPPWFEFWEG